MTKSTNGPAPEGTEPHATTENESRHDTTPPNLEALTWFHILHGERDGYIEIRAFPPGRDWPNCYWFATPEEAARLVPQLDAEGCQIFAGVARRRVYGGGKKEHLANTVAVWIDWDKPELPNLHGFPPPSFIVKSGNGYHLYWLLEEPVALDTDEGLGWLEATERGLADAVGETHAAIDAGRILRVPGTRNLKNRAAPIHCTLFENEGHVYEPEAFEAFTTRGAKPNGTTRTPYESEAWDGELPERVAVVLAESPGLRALWNGDTSSLTGEDKSDSVIDLAVANRLVGRGITDGAELEAALRYRRQQVGAKPKHDGYFTATVGKALENATSKPPISSQTPTSEEPIHSPSEGETHALPGDLSQEGLARAFVERWGDGFVWIEERREWAYWDGRVWAADPGSHRIQRTLAQLTYDCAVYAAGLEGETAKDWMRFSLAAKNERYREQTLKLISHRPGMARSVLDFDAEPWILNCPNGILDLRTGDLGPHDPKRLCTLLAGAGYNPEARSEVWEQFLEEIHPDWDTRRFLQRGAGASLVGEILDRVIYVAHGSGSNGKGTMLDALAGAFGTYAASGTFSVFSSFARKDGTAANNDQLASLPGKRLLIVNELPERTRWALDALKSYTGGDEIVTSAKYQHPIRFRPAATPWIACNHKPKLPADDEAAWHRMNLIPFEACFRPKDEMAEGDALDRPALREQLRDALENRAAVLAWAVEGLREHRRGGLGTCAAVREATAQYRDEMDEVARWIEERTEPAPGVAVASSDLYADFKDWWRGNYRHECPTAVGFGKRLTSNGVEKHDARTVRMRVGLELKRRAGA